MTFSVSCNQKESPTENKMWKYSDGYSIGDFFSIDNIHFKIANDTLYESNKPVALFVSFKRRLFADNLLTIKSLTENTIGIYCEK